MFTSSARGQRPARRPGLIGVRATCNSCELVCAVLSTQLQTCTTKAIKCWAIVLHCPPTQEPPVAPTLRRQSGRLPACARRSPPANLPSDLQISESQIAKLAIGPVLVSSPRSPRLDWPAPHGVTAPVPSARLPAFALRPHRRRRRRGPFFHERARGAATCLALPHCPTWLPSACMPAVPSAPRRLLRILLHLASRYGGRPRRAAACCCASLTSPASRCS